MTEPSASEPPEHEVPPLPRDTRPERPGVSVRTRLTVTMAVLTTLALLTAGVVIWTIESNRRSAAGIASANREIAELRSFTTSGVDPATGGAFSSAHDLLATYMARSVPGPDDMLALWEDGAVSLVTVSSHRKVVREDAFVQALEGLEAEGGSRLVETTHGQARLTVQPVKGTSGDTAALVVVSFTDEHRESLTDLMRTYAVVALLSLLLVTGIAAWQSRRLLQPLGQLAAAARDISETDLSRRVPETGNDDLTELSRTVNAMLERLETAFDGQRQFLDDAGHELRTPLTILGGHLELLDPGDPEEVDATRLLLLDEVDRMTRLVEDLILLTKSQRPDFVTPGPVDLDHLTATVLAKARPMAERDWQLDENAAVRAVVDEQRLTQALLQLVDNAVKHTDAGDTIAVGSSVHGRRARVWVRDTGAGIAAADRALVLERFGRSAVRPGDEGFGLGLSIVRAIAEAHAGSVLIEETPGGGATVIVEFALEDTAWPAS